MAIRAKLNGSHQLGGNNQPPPFLWALRNSDGDSVPSITIQANSPMAFWFWAEYEKYFREMHEPTAAWITELLKEPPRERGDVRVMWAGDLYADYRVVWDACFSFNKTFTIQVM